MEFSGQQCSRGYPFPLQGYLPDPGIKSVFPSLQMDSLLSEPPGKPNISVKPYIWKVDPKWWTQSSPCSGVCVCARARVHASVHVCVCVCVCVFCQHQVHIPLVESAFSSFTTLGIMIYCQTQSYLAHLHNLSGFWRQLTLYLLIKSIPTPKSVINRHLLSPPGVSTPSLITSVSVRVEPRKKL